MPVRIGVIAAPDVGLPPQVNTVAVVDRSGNADGPAVAAGMLESLQSSPGLRALPAQIPGRGPLPSDQVGPALRGVGAQLLVVIEEVHISDQVTSEVGREEGLAGAPVTATRGVRGSAKVQALLTDGPFDTHEVALNRSWPATAGSEKAAEDSLPSALASRALVAKSLGHGYAARIASTWVSVVRTVYVAGDPKMVGLRTMVTVGDWGSAQHVWVDLLNSSASPVVKGRAAHSLSVGAEFRGDLISAERYAEEAVRLWDRPVTQRQLTNVRNRRMDASAH